MYDEKFFKAIVVKGNTQLIRKIQRKWWAEHRYATLKDFAQRVDSPFDVQER